ncbi:hypothetical protein DFH09DRAFT_1094446 [Mycena vulgaris]|nr:hypothetical protein DFH09DRAFT_1094446 [Mycena vulgaris]
MTPYASSTPLSRHPPTPPSPAQAHPTFTTFDPRCMAPAHSFPAYRPARPPRTSTRAPPSSACTPPGPHPYAPAHAAHRAMRSHPSYPALLTLFLVTSDRNNKLLTSLLKGTSAKRSLSMNESSLAALLESERALQPYVLPGTTDKPVTGTTRESTSRSLAPSSYCAPLQPASNCSVHIQDAVVPLALTCTHGEGGAQAALVPWGDRFSRDGLTRSCKNRAERISQPTLAVEESPESARNPGKTQEAENEAPE